ncbi:MAG: hypothetical protein AAF410_06510, partial [Pseudomonadota bacterium]
PPHLSDTYSAPSPYLDHCYPMPKQCVRGSKAERPNADAAIVSSETQSGTKRAKGNRLLVTGNQTIPVTTHTGSLLPADVSDMPR